MDELYQFRVHWNRHTYLQLLLVQIASGREGLAYDWFLVNRFPRRGRILWKGLSIACSLSTIRVRCRDANSLARLPRSALRAGVRPPRNEAWRRRPSITSRSQ